VHRLLSASIIPIATFPINSSGAVAAGLFLFVIFGRIEKAEDVSSAFLLS